MSWWKKSSWHWNALERPSDQQHHSKALVLKHRTYFYMHHSSITFYGKFCKGCTLRTHMIRRLGQTIKGGRVSLAAIMASWFCNHRVWNINLFHETAHAFCVYTIYCSKYILMFKVQLCNFSSRPCHRVGNNLPCRVTRICMSIMSPWSTYHLC